jgi:hypothetical protein
MSENRIMGQCPVLSTDKKPFPVILLTSKNELPMGSEKMLEASNESWSHYISPAGGHYGMKRKNPKRYI